MYIKDKRRTGRYRGSQGEDRGRAIATTATDQKVDKSTFGEEHRRFRRPPVPKTERKFQIMLQQMSYATHYKPVTLIELQAWAQLLETSADEGLPCPPETILMLGRLNFMVEFDTGNILSEDEVTIVGHVAKLPFDAKTLFYRQITPPGGDTA